MFARKIVSIFALLSVIFLGSHSIAQEEASRGLNVSEAAIATGIENLTPQGASETFLPSVGKLYAFSRITDAKGETIVKHRWFYGDRLMAEIRLPVKSANWRTYSSKIILSAWTGPWRVEIADEDGAVLQTLQFTIE